MWGNLRIMSAVMCLVAVSACGSSGTSSDKKPGAAGSAASKAAALPSTPLDTASFDLCTVIDPASVTAVIGVAPKPVVKKTPGPGDANHPSRTRYSCFFPGQVINAPDGDYYPGVVLIAAGKASKAKEVDEFINFAPHGGTCEPAATKSLGTKSGATQCVIPLGGAIKVDRVQVAAFVRTTFLACTADHEAGKTGAKPADMVAFCAHVLETIAAK